jgi:hypothetical protein
MNAQAKTQPKVSPERLTRVYLKIRARQADIKAQFEDELKVLDSQLERVKDALLEYCKENDIKTLRTDAGTVSRMKTTKYWTSDWESLYAAIRKHGNPEILTRRIHQNNMRDFLLEHPDEIPMGLNAEVEQTIRITKAKATAKEE